MSSQDTTPLLYPVMSKCRYPVSAYSNIFKVFLGNNYRIQEKVITVPKKTLFLVLPYLGPFLLQTRTKLKAFLIVASYRLCLKVKTN